MMLIIYVLIEYFECDGCCWWEICDWLVNRYGLLIDILEWMFIGVIWLLDYLLIISSIDL